MSSKDLNIFTDHKVSMHGYVTRVSVLRNGVIVRHKEYETPVKNMIVNSGKNYWFKPSLTILGYDPYTLPLGLLTYYCGRSESSTPTTADMTSLTGEITTPGRTNTLFIGDPNTGVRYNRETNTIFARKTYDFQPELVAHNIRSIGFFTSSTSGTMFSRVVLPSDVTVGVGEQLRVTYELQITVNPAIVTTSAPTITGWVTDGQGRLEGGMPATSSVYGSQTNQFIAVWGTDGKLATQGFASGGSVYTPPIYYQDLLEPGSLGYTTSRNTAGANSAASYHGLFIYTGTTYTLNTFGYMMPDGGASYPAANYRAGMYAATPPGNNSPGSWSNTLQAYVDGNFYRDQTIVLDPSFPAVNLTQIKALQARGFTWIFTNPVAKSTTQRLTLTYRISLA